MQPITLEEAQRHLPEIIEQLTPGEEVLLTWSPDHSFVVQGGEAPPDEG